MLIVSYDISDNKTRGKFSKFLKQFGRRIQFSVYELEHSERFLKIILLEIEQKFMKRFTNSDSVLIIDLNSKKIHRYGYAFNEEQDILYF